MPPQPSREPLPTDTVKAFHQTLSNWDRWGPDDQKGTLNFITPAATAAAAATVQSGRTVSCARPLNTIPSADNTNPVAHHMIGTHTEGWGADYFAIAPHGFATSHLDALCHVFHDGHLYNGHPTTAVTAHGAAQLGIHHLAQGIVSRGVLLDIPRLRGHPDTGLPPGDPIYVDELEAAAAAAQLELQPGDILFVRTGRWRWRDEHGPWDIGDGLAGLDAACLPLLHERGIAALGSDGVSDVLPSRVPGVLMPVHETALVAMGLHLLDNLDFEVLAAACAAEHRWAFLLTIAPLVLLGGTASPVNPIAVF